MGALNGGQLRCRQIRDLHICGCFFADLSPFQGHERRAEPFHAGKVFVAAGLVNRALAPQLGLFWCDGDAIGLHAAIPAAFADIRVDEDTLVGIGEQSPLAPPPLLCRTGLDIEDRAHAFFGGEVLLHLLQFGPLMHRQTFEGRRINILFLVIDHRKVLHPHGLQLSRNAGRAEITIVVLPPGHGNCIVIKDLVGDVGACRQSSADRLHTGVVIGAVPDILEHMITGGEWRFADPVGPFGPHVCEAQRFPVHPLRHEVTANPGIGTTAFWHFGRGIVRTARAEIGQTRGDLFGIVSATRLIQSRKARFDPIGLAPLFAQHAAQLFGDIDRIQRPAR